MNTPGSVLLNGSPLDPRPRRADSQPWVQGHHTYQSPTSRLSRKTPRLLGWPWNGLVSGLAIAKMLLRAADRNDAADALDDARIGWDGFRTARGNENALGRSSPGSWSSTWEVPRRRSKLICGRQPQMSPTYDKTGTTAYVLRDHDTKLREALAELKEPGARPG